MKDIEAAGRVASLEKCADFMFGEYSELAWHTAVYPEIGKNYVYPALGLCGEAGEVAEKIKKILRDKDGEIDEEALEQLARELGDVLWYINALCKELGLRLSDVARDNLTKLYSRKNRGKVKGSGDDR